MIINIFFTVLTVLMLGFGSLMTASPKAMEKYTGWAIVRASIVLAGITAILWRIS